MGYILEPDGVDLIIGPTKPTEEDFKAFREAFAYYRKHGKFKTVPIPKVGPRKKAKTTARKKSIKKSPSPRA
jgi:hypothetical protein